IGTVFKSLHAQLGDVTKALDVIVALGTHQPMPESAICKRLEMSEEERRTTFRRVKFFNHAWNDASALRDIGAIPAEEISKLSNGLFAMDVPVQINRLV